MGTYCDYIYHILGLYLPLAFACLSSAKEENIATKKFSLIFCCPVSLFKQAVWLHTRAAAGARGIWTELEMLWNCYEEQCVGQEGPAVYPL